MALTDEQIADIAREAALAALAQQPAEPDTGPMARIETTLAVSLHLISKRSWSAHEECGNGINTQMSVLSSTT